MSDNMMPELTLNPTEAAQEAVPELTLTPEAPAAPEAEKKEVEPVKVDESMLTEQEKKAVNDFAKKIDITDTNLVLNYGVAAQKSVATFSENALSSVRNKDLGEVGETLSNLVVEVKGRVGHHTSHRHPHAPLKLVEAGLQKGHISAELVDNASLDHAPLVVLKQGMRAYKLGKHAAAVDVAHKQHR